MITSWIIFGVALSVLLISARFFTDYAEKIGVAIRLPPFVVGVFIVGIGTSLPELIAGIIAVKNGVSEMLPANVVGANISNILLITGLAVIFYRKTIILQSQYLYIDLHFLVGSFLYFMVIAYDGVIVALEAFPGIFIFGVYGFFLIRSETFGNHSKTPAQKIRWIYILGLLVSAIGIYVGAEFTIQSLEEIALALSIPRSMVALTILSLGTTLPELAVNVTAIRKGHSELVIGNVLGSCVFNALLIPSVASFIGPILVSQEILSFPLYFMAACGLLFYLLTHDKKISMWEGMMFVILYVVFLLQIIS